MNILEEVRSLLEQAEYRTKSTPEQETICYFEDSNLLGLIVVYETVSSLIDNWEGVQDTFLKSSSSQIKKDPRKAWNAYSIHMSAQDADEASVQELERIEEDFRGTRKITAASVKSRSDVRQALLPLLPIQNLMSLTNRGDMERIQNRIAPEGGPLMGLTGSLPPADIADALAEKK